MAGTANRSLGGPNAANYDLFLIKLHEVPEPATIALTGDSLLVLLMQRRRKN